MNMGHVRQLSPPEPGYRRRSQLSSLAMKTGGFAIVVNEKVKEKKTPIAHAPISGCNFVARVPEKENRLDIAKSCSDCLFRDVVSRAMNK